MTDVVLVHGSTQNAAGFGGLVRELPTVALCDLSAVHAEVSTDDAARVRSTYLLPGDDRALRRTWMLRVARERLHVEPVPLPGGHNCRTAHPVAVAAAVDRVA